MYVIVFLQDHYPRPINNIPDILGRVLCYVRYCFPVLNLRLSHNFFLENYSLFYFIENSFVYKNYKNILSNRGRNMVVTGHPIIDTFSSSNNNKLIIKKKSSLLKSKKNHMGATLDYQ